MPAFQNSPFAPPVLHMKGVPTYLWGSYDPRVGNTRAYVTNTVLASDVVTVTLQILDGPMPVVGAPISIINSTNGSGAFNVNRAIITAVSINAGTGAGTVTFALTHADISTAADGGSVIMENAEIPETLAAGASIAAVIQVPDSDSQYTVPVSVTFPTMPTAATVTLQRALVGRDNLEWTNMTAVVTVAVSAYTAGPMVEATLERGYLYRLLVSGITGSGTILGRIGG